MTIEKNLQGSNLEIKVSGRLDTTTSPELEEEIKASEGDAEELVMNLSDLEYISSAGLRVLLAAQKIMSQKGGMKVTGVNDDIMEILDVTGFSSILTLE